MRQRNIGWRLDYVLASQRIFDITSRTPSRRGIAPPEMPVPAPRSWVCDPKAPGVASNTS